MLLKGTDGNGKRWKQDREQIWKCGNVEMWKCMQGKDVCAKEKMEHGTEKTWKQGTDGNLHVCTTEVQLYSVSVSVREKI